MKSSSQRSRLVAIEHSPAMEEWAIISNFKAKEYEKIKEQEKISEMEKKMKFKRELDNQLNGKQNVNVLEKKRDKEYSQAVIENVTKEDRKELEDRILKMIKRKKMDQMNVNRSEILKNSRQNDREGGTYMQIGLKSEIEHKNKSQTIKKDMVDSLEQQVKLKEFERKQNKIQNFYQDQKNLAYQMGQVNRSQKRGVYGQNEEVYHIFDEINHQKQQKVKQIESKFVDRAKQKKMQEQTQRIQKDELRVRVQKERVKEILAQQVDYKNYKKQQERKINPEEINYSCIDGIFKPKKYTYDKNKYYEDLRRQADEHRNQQTKQGYMSPQEYRLNMNQLNKAVNGSYAHNSYVDRSLGSIGDSSKVKAEDVKNNFNQKDSSIVKNNLQTLKDYGYADRHRRNDTIN